MAIFEAFGNFNRDLTNALTGGGPKPVYWGGSKEELDRTRGMYQGIGDAGQATLGSGVATLGQAAGMAGDQYRQGGSLFDSRLIQGDAAQASQRQMFGDAIATARNRPAGESAAELQLRLQNDRNTRAMLGQAASARGGNQLAALRNAQMIGSQNALATNQQMAVIRAQEEQARINATVQAQQAAGQAFGQQAGMGYGLASQGLGAQQQASGQLGQFGGQLGQLGIGQQNLGYGSLNQVNQSQFDADRGASAGAAVAGNSTAAFGNLFGGISSIWGGGQGGGMNQGNVQGGGQGGYSGNANYGAAATAAADSAAQAGRGYVNSNGGR